MMLSHAGLVRGVLLAGMLVALPSSPALSEAGTNQHRTSAQAERTASPMRKSPHTVGAFYFPGWYRGKADPTNQWSE